MSYVYRLKWSKTNMNYYGVRFAKNCDPKELWVTYFTSSKHVKNYCEEYGSPDIIEVRKVFTSSKKARIWENRVLKKLKVVKRKDYLNKTDNFAIDPTTSNCETRKKAVETRKKNGGFKNPKLSELNKLKIGDKNPSKNPEVRLKLSISKKGINNPMYGKRGISSPRYGKSGSSKGKRWFYDPINLECKYFHESDKPDGWILGRIFKKNK